MCRGKSLLAIGRVADIPAERCRFLFIGRQVMSKLFQPPRIGGLRLLPLRLRHVDIRHLKYMLNQAVLTRSTANRK